jgi:Zn-dependent M28 family amino/carboxypeptidase
LFAGAKRPLSAVLDEADRSGGKPKGFALRQRVSFERESQTKKIASPNVVGMIPGSDPELKDEYVLLMAHLDHVGMDPTREGDKIYNGAMDNSVGIATLIEVARAMTAAPEKPKRSILIAAVTAEEDGLLGAQYLARNPVVGKGKVVGVVNLDMPVLLYDFQDVIAFGSEHSTLGPIVARAAGRMNVALSADPLPQEGLFTRSDHYRFVQEGVPSVFLMTGFAGPGREAFTGFLAKHYHKPSDDLALPIDWNAGAKFARINFLIANEIANAPERPRWYSDSFFGQTVAAGQEKAKRPAS